MSTDTLLIIGVVLAATAYVSHGLHHLEKKMATQADVQAIADRLAVLVGTPFPTPVDTIDLTPIETQTTVLEQKFAPGQAQS